MAPFTRLTWVAVAAIALIAAAPVSAQTSAAQTAQAQMSASSSTADDPRWPLLMVGWAYQSLAGNSAAGNVILSKRRGGVDNSLWRGLQASTLVGRRGFEAGLGYGGFAIGQVPLGYEFRGLAGRTFSATGPLAAHQTYVGGEVVGMFAYFRGTLGLVVPVGAGVSHRPAVTGSFGVSMFWSKFPKLKRPSPGR